MLQQSQGPINKYIFVYIHLLGGDTFRLMKASPWEFKNRVMVFGMIFGLAYPLYFLDHQNASAALARWIGARLRFRLSLSVATDANFVARYFLAFAALLLIAVALIRTWASSYLGPAVVYAGEVKTQAVVADGPYRWVRHPLYLAVVLMAIGVGATMSRTGLLVTVAATLLFCYRLILREEAELQASHGEQYEHYCKAVPRLWPSLGPRISSAGRRPQWGPGFKAELWSWGFAAAVATFAVTVSLKLFVVMLAASAVFLFAFSAMMRRKSSAQASGKREEPQQNQG